ncbi:tyrosine-type recombinase/integrase [Helicobacter kayseriensis]|uniref:tyrosine-type recombinase/integrase n=1 Tax=Helicobacter kayseriensis TaxID=2905877 RepID=UPI001E61A6B2|nr:tyrosine-type recombinase/integrase [Helicobacter kayseriensis]MCE3046795.1 tyrosine-type recombinase/integrase [Helicobacter kayseriensis]MCE3047903.1 tyrosine-type recombinase/integrase [Helicobacter kayseriensis]
MSQLLNCKANFADSLLFWLTRFLRYKLTTLSSKNVQNRDAISLIIAKFQALPSSLNELEILCKEARKNGLIGIATYANPLLKLYPYLVAMSFERLEQIHEELLIDFLTIQGSGLSSATKKNYRVAMIGFFAYLDKHNRTEDGKAHIFNIELKNIGGIRGRSGQKLPAYMNETEIDIFLRSIDEYPQSQKIAIRNRLILKLIIYTGIRVSEALNLRMKDIFPQKEVYLLQIRGKGDKMRVVMIKRQHIESLLMQWIKQKKELGIKSELLFCNQKGESLSQAYIYKVVDQILSYGGIYKEKMGAHMLRHSFATLLYQKSQDLVLVQEALGHADLNTSRIYTHFDTNRLIQAASIMDEMGK